MPLLCLFIICAINGNVKPSAEKLHCRIAPEHGTLPLSTSQKWLHAKHLENAHHHGDSSVQNSGVVGLS